MKFFVVVLTAFCVTTVCSVAIDLSFPWYSSILLSAQGLYVYANRAPPIWVKVAWWGSFVSEDGGVLDSVKAVMQVCDTCKSEHRDLHRDNCTQESLNAVKSIVQNVITLAVGWSVPGAISDVVIDANHRRSVSKGDVISMQRSVLTLIALFLIPFLPGLVYILIVISQVPLL